MFCDGCHRVKDILGNYLDYNTGITILSVRLVKGFWQVMVYQNKTIKESIMTRIFKTVISTLVILSLVAVLPAETTVKADQVEFATENDSNNAVFASAEIKKKKKKGKKIKKKGKKKKKGFFSKFKGAK
jgi:hypothetical protein